MSFNQFFILFFTHVLRLPERQTTEAWEPTESNGLSELKIKYLQLEIYFGYIFWFWADLLFTLYSMCITRTKVLKTLKIIVGLESPSGGCGCLAFDGAQQ
jgi:hypothetical protein